MKREKQIILLALGIFVLAVFFLLPRNTQWMADRVVPYWKDLQNQKEHLSLEERKQARYKGAYTHSQQIATLLPDHSTALVLVPPAGYFTKHGIDYPVPEPAIFYYYTGLKTTWATSRMAARANWIAGMDKGKIVVRAVTNPRQLADSIVSFKKFTYTL